MQTDTQPLPEKGSVVTFTKYDDDSPGFEPILEPGQLCVVAKTQHDDQGNLLLEIFPCDDVGVRTSDKGDQVYLSEVEFPAPAPAEERQPMNPDSQADMDFHPLADTFPLVEGEAFQELVEDIRANGQREEIVTLGGLILDGRNRFRACREAGVQPTSIEFDPSTMGDPAAFVISRNLQRRHLDTTQKAMAAAKLSNMRQGARTDLGHPANLHNVTSQAEAAEKMSVSRRSLNSAKKVLSAGIPELVEAVEAGELPLFRAASIAQKSKAEQRARAEAGWRAPKAEPKPLGQRAQAQLDAVEAAWAKHVKEAWEGAGRQARTRFIKSLKG